ncbi:class B secretin-like G-protein coupled receptor GPRmth4, putative [Pediculus humanus corporis]|uniref:Class B secretin-like G-protein coupled receptor GPRmth4, putative n=1 Tax=Pediculus humanus subsp. corporis TaxID=121224 RepID=E0VYH0_PEDHC|nr:class B secretin-like G-protein coupled receptor GPRmth4, putative [Pediculus humanus corporis]EEB18426.1 class B secretin-like G-protein coupled receptor GPRmth4, putative [Pediculus humanus corporis]
MKLCCPENSYLINNSNICSDNKTRYDLHCETGALLLDPNDGDDDDKFTIESNGSLIIFNGEERNQDEFCVGKILKNDSSTSSNFVALVCFRENDYNSSSSEDSNFISILLRLFMIISILFLLITLYIYAILPNLRDLQGKCVIAFICCLVSSYVTLFVIQTFPNSTQTTCVTQAAILYFFLSSSFFWNNVITFNVWNAIRRKSSPKFHNNKFLGIFYVLWGFGIPLLMVAISFIMEYIPGRDHVKPHFGETKCWFKGKLESWSYFHGPVSVLLVFNSLMFCHSSWMLWKRCRDSTISTIRSLKFKCVMYLKLFLLMGVTWIFEMISYATSDMSEYTKYLWLLTDCINSAQGVLIFLILVAFRQKVRLGLLNKKLFGIRWPRSWANEEIQESSTSIFINDDMELEKQKTKIMTNFQKGSDTD